MSIEDHRTASAPAASVRDVEVFGFKATVFTRPQLLDLVSGEVRGGGRCIVNSQNLHGVYTFFRDARMRALHARARVRMDGMPIVWLARLAGHKVGRAHRIAWIDLFWPFMERAEAEGWRIFYLGAKPEVLDKGIARVRERFPKLQLRSHDGFFDQTPSSAGNQAVVEEINRFQPDVLIVGMGMPRQENWVLGNHEQLEAKVIMTAGACIEFIAGAVPTPPRWMGALGLEWLHRLSADPRRFAFRYLVEPWIVLALLARHAIKKPLRSAASS